MNLSIIIVSWNTREYLLRCLDSIGNPVSLDGEIIVIDNFSHDGSTQAIRQHFAAVKTIENSNNVGFGAANNQGIEHSTGKYVLLLNSDTKIIPGAIETLVKFLDDHPSAGAAGPLLLNDDSSLQDSCYPFPTLGRETWRLFHLDHIKRFGTYDQKSWDKNAIREVDSLKGACILLRREVLDQAGGFDPAFFMYTEEIDLCYRIKKANWKLYWVPNAEVIHFGGQSTRLAADKMFLSLYETKVLFFRKHYGNLSALVYKIILFLASLPRIAMGLLGWIEPEARRIEHQNVAKRYLHLVAALRKV